MLGILMLEVFEEWYCEEEISLAMNYLDYYLPCVPTRKAVSAHCMVCLLLASKLHKTIHTSI